MSGFAYPIVADLTGRPCLVIGGGAVALRKVAGLVEAGARVTVVSPWLTPALLRLAAEAPLRWRPREYALGDAAGFTLVMVAELGYPDAPEIAREIRERSDRYSRTFAPAILRFAFAEGVEEATAEA